MTQPKIFELRIQIVDLDTHTNSKKWAEDQITAACEAIHENTETWVIEAVATPCTVKVRP